MATDGSSGVSGGDSLPPATRRRLQQCFEQGNLRLTQENFDYAAELFQTCVTGDPSNVIYLQSFLGTLRRKYNDNKKGSKLAGIQGTGHRSAVKRAAKQKDWRGVIKAGVEMLKLNPWHVPTLAAMAEACKELGFHDTQLVYLKMAQEANPNDPEVQRMCARALGELGHYDQAIACWHRVEQLRPGDEEAAKAVATLTVEKTIARGGYEDPTRQGKKVPQPSGATAVETQPAAGGAPTTEQLEREVAANPGDAEKAIRLAEIYAGTDQLDRAETVLSRAVEANEDEELRERLLDVQFRKLLNRYRELERRAGEQKGEQLQQQLAEARRQMIAKDVELYEHRAKRFPNNLAIRFDLGLRYKAAGRFNEAIAEFQQARNDSRRRGVCLLELGECFQHIKQYKLAMNHYEQAVEEIPERDTENAKLALYRAGRLALGLRELDKADRYLTKLAGIDYAFRDVPRLLEKLATLRQQGGGSTPEAGPDTEV